MPDRPAASARVATPARRLLVAVAAAAAVLAAVPAAARADGDPASDYLYTQTAFLPAGASSSEQAGLRTLTHAARARGAPIRVAVIASPYDLGSITPLWRKPQTYARFLGTELSYVFHGTLLVVMPNGFGLYHDKRPIAADQRALDGLSVEPGMAGLVASAETAVRRLAAAQGHPLPAVSTTPSAAPSAAGSAKAAPSSGGGVGLVALAVLVAGGVVIAAAWALSLHLRPARRPRLPHRRAAPAHEHGRRPPLRPLKAAAIIVPVALAAGGLAAVFVPRHAGVAADAGAPAQTAGQGFTWPAGARPAPSFALRDQAGTPISLRSVRGRVAIIAFLDPACRNLCPLEASVLGQVVRQFPAQSRPAVVAVSVNPWSEGRPQLLQDIRKWKVGPGWRWAVGSHAELAAVWRAYGIGVQDRQVRIAGVKVHEITHTEVIYLLDGHGNERQLFPYPFTAGAVVRGVRSIQRAAS
jgi:cytochrome oxidase Cu insertion factor (SCO1/SenC/PrrC family)